MAVFACFVLILGLSSLLQAEGVYVGFGESDYREIEGTPHVSVVIQKHGVNSEDVVLTLTSHLFHELSGEYTDGIDPAEYFIDGRKDFHKVDKIITFSPSDVHMEKTVAIPFHDDDINEAPEGFLLVLTVNELNKEKDVEFLRGGNVTLIRIGDNDDIRLSFERSRYDVTEQDMEVNDLIYVVKEGNATTEQVLEVFIVHSQNTGSTFATIDEDFELEDVTVLTFLPGQQRLPVPFKLFQDAIAEETEEFRLSLSVPQYSALYTLGSRPFADVYIHDDDIAVIGFESTVYTIEENAGILEVCVVLFQPQNGTSSVIIGNVKSVDKEATSGEDYHSVSERIRIDGDRSRDCFQVAIINDTSSESLEEFELELTLDTSHTHDSLSVIARPNRTVTVIRDDDQLNIEIPPLKCHRNAELIQISDSEQRCVCRDGYEGDGIRRCRDINECQRNTDNCDVNAVCRNTRGSFMCRCRQGYSGDGRTCEDVDECASGTHDCSPLARCINTQGSYSCVCNEGFTGNGKTCLDINECRLNQHNCDVVNGYCINTWGSFTCRCRAGFHGDGINCDRIEQTPRTRSRGTKSCSRHTSRSRSSRSRHTSKSRSSRSRSTRKTHTKRTRSSRS